MYLKSIEVQGFKSFANKIVFEFHNGITGIVGPNGSGKSNVADAVRWVLGEQSAKQLRGANMQDVIFAGTENRKPLSYAYVAITMDNSDHQLALDYEEVTVARRVYRSGESEYLINGNPCRLKDVNELFYDTGIGKEGYSIIGQGQIDRILSGKPEERRELFDEAAGIVKYKRRKNTAQKKLESERENLVRVNDILNELESRIGPLERQSEKAKIYLKAKEDLKIYDVNMFLLEVERIEKALEDVTKSYTIASQNLEEQKTSYETIRKSYETMEQELSDMDLEMTKTREAQSESLLTKGKLEGQISLLEEKIRSAQMSDEHVKSRFLAIEEETKERLLQKGQYDKEKETLETELSRIASARAEAEKELAKIQGEITRCSEGIDAGKKELISLLNQKASMKADGQRFETMMEQVNIRKAELNKNLLKRKGEEAGLKENLNKQEEALRAAKEEIDRLEALSESIKKKDLEWQDKRRKAQAELEEKKEQFHKESSRLESLQNIAERYDGYGNSIRKVMEQKEREKGICGVVADLIRVEKKYETAIETALGGNIQNIVTEDEATAKKMISFLKQNRLGRATFLPLTSVTGKSQEKNEKFLTETGVIGFANTLVQADTKYEGVLSYLLGRVLAVDTIDHAIALAKKSGYSLHLVTLEGEYLSPGGSIAGGAFKNSSNLLGRKREIEDLQDKIELCKKEMAKFAERITQIDTAKDLLADDARDAGEKLQNQYLVQNTAKLGVERAREQWEASEQVFAGLQKESTSLEEQMQSISDEKKKAEEALTKAVAREQEIAAEGEAFQKILDEQMYLEEGAMKRVSELQMEEANAKQKVTFALENMQRVDSEIAKLSEESDTLKEQSQESVEDIEKKKRDIEKIKQTIASAEENYKQLGEKLKDTEEKKEKLSVEYKGFFQKREEVSEVMNGLDKEIFRLNNQREKLEEAKTYQSNYMWTEYELTYHNALSLKDDTYTDGADLKKRISKVKDEIRHLGDVNVNAIEEYKEVSTRYDFLKGQHDDLVESEQTLLGIIDDLDKGMRAQFTEKFAEIQKEFDRAFKDLFGGGKGTLELVEDEDILECGIRIIAQPPGKKLQNMMQLSGGEKALTAIALLFAIQNMKPSPFCLLDEIEAALDDSNVGRFAKYLNKLTKNTQFIIITHRRGTMAAADRLYGITMQEKGVSTLVSVNLIENELSK